MDNSCFTLAPPTNAEDCFALAIESYTLGYTIAWSLLLFNDSRGRAAAVKSCSSLQIYDNYL